MDRIACIWFSSPKGWLRKPGQIFEQTEGYDVPRSAGCEPVHIRADGSGGTDGLRRGPAKNAGIAINNVAPQIEHKEDG
jgi:hypothetical protein